MVSVLISAALLATLHALRGHGILPRWFVLLAVFILSAAAWGALTGAIVAAGVALWLIPPIGKYFMAIHGNHLVHAQTTGCVKWIDYLTDRAVGTPGTTRRARRWGTVGMSLRGLFAWPLFVELALAAGDPRAAVLGLLMALQGPIYYASGRISLMIDNSHQYAVRIAEVLTGGLLGALIALAVDA